MKPLNPILRTSLQTVTFVFAAFGGFLIKVAPPTDALSVFATGLASFACLFALLFVRLAYRKFALGPYRPVWIGVALLLAIVSGVFGFRYADDFQDRTYEYPPERPEMRFTAGTNLTDTAKPYDTRGLSSAQIVAKVGGPDNAEKVWLADSLKASKQRLRRDYVFFTLALATALFALLEAYPQKI